jgi:ADP-L-glycero-D-manno-heptose 6-epimerase
MYIVTGGAGFIGSAMLWKLNAMGVEDIVVVDELGHDDKWKNLVNRRYADYIHKDVFLDMVLEDSVPFAPTAVIHMGACSSTTETDADYLMSNNYHYSATLCSWALEQGARFVNASSAATYGDGSQGFSDDHAGLGKLRPLNMYGYSKQLFDLWALREGVMDQVASLKFFNVFGPNEYHKGDMMSVVRKAHTQITATGTLKLFKSYRPEYPDGGQQRDFVYVKDCCDLMWWLLERPDVNGVFNVGAGQARAWNDLAAAVFAALGRPVSVEYIEMPEVLRGKYQYFTQAEMAKLRAAGYAAAFTPLEEAVADYVQNYLEAADPYL